MMSDISDHGHDRRMIAPVTARTLSSVITFPGSAVATTMCLFFPADGNHLVAASEGFWISIPTVASIEVGERCVNSKPDPRRALSGGPIPTLLRVRARFDRECAPSRAPFFKGARQHLIVDQASRNKPLAERFWSHNISSSEDCRRDPTQS